MKLTTRSRLFIFYFLHSSFNQWQFNRPAGLMVTPIRANTAFSIIINDDLKIDPNIDFD